MSTNKNNIQPSFLLKNINVNDLHKKYTNGYFNRPIPIKKSIPLTVVKNVIKQQHTLHNKVPSKSIQLSGQKYVEIFNTNTLIDKRCDFCKRDFEGEIIGYPVAYEEKQKLLDTNTYKIYHLFWTEGCFHSYECCLGYIETYSDYFNKYNLEFDVKVMFKYMYSLMYDAQLKPANDPKLLITHGGSMTFDEWNDQNERYVKSNEVIKMPAQIIYNKI